MSKNGYFSGQKIFLGVINEVIRSTTTVPAQQEQVQNGVQCSVSWLCLSWLAGAEIAASDFTVHSSMSAQGKQESPNR